MTDPQVKKKAKLKNSLLPSIVAFIGLAIMNPAAAIITIVLSAILSSIGLGWNDMAGTIMGLSQLALFIFIIWGAHEWTKRRDTGN